MGLELKDMILQTLAEIDTTNQTIEKIAEEVKETTRYKSMNLPVLDEEPRHISPLPLTEESSVICHKEVGSEKVFLEHLKERMGVLFDGLQSTEITEKEKKLDLTLNFLEYVLALTQKRLDELA